MIGLSTVLFDLTGFLILHPVDSSNRIYDINRRISRVATLDLDTDLTDLGYTDADRNFKFEIPDLSESEVLAISALIKLHSQFVLCTNEGAFFVTPKAFSYSKGLVFINLLSTGSA